MKLFFLMLPFLGINLFCHLSEGQKKETVVKVERSSSFQMMPSALLVDFN